jgi:4-hydroxybenzoate polyprenyltransferase
MVDREDDLKLGLKTAAITFGRFDVLAIGICYAMALALLVIAGGLMQWGAYYYSGLALALGIAITHLYWIRGRDRKACFKAFRHNNWFGAAVFAGIVLQHALG